jgi:cell division protease FtsH
MMSYFHPALKANRRIFAVAVAVISLLLLAVFLFAGFRLFLNPAQRTNSVEISFAELLHDIDAGRVHDMLIKGAEIYGTFNDGRNFQTDAPTDPALIQHLYNKGVPITTQP